MNALLGRFVLALALILLLLPLPAPACVGKTLLIASTGTAQQNVLAQMLAILIGERTGTTAKVVMFESAKAAHDASLKADLDILVEYVGQAQGEVLKKPVLADAAAQYAAVKESYNQELNLVWLAPLGFDDAKYGQAAPVARKDTLKKFPALPRLINKLGGLIDNETVRRFEAEIKAGKTPQEVARLFLKGQKLI